MSNTNCRDDDKAPKAATGAPTVATPAVAAAAVAAAMAAAEGRPRPRGTLRTGNVVTAGENVSLTMK